MSKYIELPRKGFAVFVGDTHGDYLSTRLVINNYINKKDYYIVMLGDYIDRGEDSRKNIDYLLEMKKRYSNLILLAGNHEMHCIRECSPSDFWNSMKQEEKSFYNGVFSSLPLAVTGNGFIALHGALPDIKAVEDIDKIEPGDENWMRITWGDLRDKPGGVLKPFLGRPKLGADYFKDIMGRLNLNVLIRGHDSIAPEVMFGGRCLTLFTSVSYNKRKIAICNLEKEIRNIGDLDIISLDNPEI